MHIFMDRKPEYVTITDREISSFVQAIMKVFNLFFERMTFGALVYMHHDKSMYEIFPGLKS